MNKTIEERAKENPVLIVIDNGRLIHAGDPATFESEALVVYARLGKTIKTIPYEEYRNYKLYEPIPASPDANEVDYLHPDSENLLKVCFEELRLKMAKNEKKYGWENEWLTDDWEEECRQQMIEHLKKGDPKDVAIYAMFMMFRGWSTKSPDAGDWKSVVRKAFAEYVATEGCTCCQDVDGHKEAERKLAELLHPKPYDDLSGWDWKLPSPPKNDNP